MSQKQQISVTPAVAEKKRAGSGAEVVVCIMKDVKSATESLSEPALPSHPDVENCSSRDVSAK